MIEINAVVDTAFQGALKLLVDQAEAVELDLFQSPYRHQLPTGEWVRFRMGDATVDWLGEARTVTVLVPEKRRHEDAGEPSKKGNTTALIGGELLASTLLSINYCNKTLTIVPCHQDIA
jgi:predicted aspartyl protease